MITQSYFSTEQAATYIGLSRRTLETMRCRGDGPDFIKAGRRCLYRVADLDAWALARIKSSTSDSLVDRNK